MKITQMLDALETGVRELQQQNRELGDQVRALRLVQPPSAALQPPSDASGVVITPQPLPKLAVNWTFQPDSSGPDRSLNRREELRQQMLRARLSEVELAGLLAVPVATVEQWLKGHYPVPSWVLPGLRSLELLTPAARDGMRNSMLTRRGNRPVNRHPFSRIEEL